MYNNSKKNDATVVGTTILKASPESMCFNTNIFFQKTTAGKWYVCAIWKKSPWVSNAFR